jgi:hypothetical protein
LKYDNEYTGSFEAYKSHTFRNRKDVVSDTPSPSDVSIVPTKGIVRVYSKNPLVSTDEHFVAASVHTIHGGRKLVLCCVDEDATFAAHVLREAALRHCGY